MTSRTCKKNLNLVASVSVMIREKFDVQLRFLASFFICFLSLSLALICNGESRGRKL
jgi:hypothetical protein